MILKEFSIRKGNILCGFGAKEVRIDPSFPGQSMYDHVM